MGKPIVLAYTGGIDAAVALHWLTARGNEVVTFTGDIGQSGDFDALRQSALHNGVANGDNVVVKDLKREFVTDFIWPAIRANAIYENRYLLGGALPKPLLGKMHAVVAKQKNIRTLAHGATSGQNDKIRYQKAYDKFHPECEVYVPWDDSQFSNQFDSREAMLAYKERNDVQSSTSISRPWTSEDHLFHTSYEDIDLSDFAARRRKDMLGIPTPQEAPDEPTYLEIKFEMGTPIEVTYDCSVYSEPVEIMRLLNELGGKNAIGIIDIVETNLDGRKSRGVYVTSGGTILRKAHIDIEGATMKGEDIEKRDTMIPGISSSIYAGDWYSDGMIRNLQKMDEFQKPVSGIVTLGLYKGNVIIEGRQV